MRKIAICDDQKEIVEFIRDTCEKFYFQKDIVNITCFESGEAIVRNEKHFDAIFLDVELENMNGIEAGLQIRKTDHDVLIIMISGHEKYKLKAYPLHVFDFLDKPFTEKNIFNVLKEVENYCNKKKDPIFVSFKMKSGNINLNVEDIIYFESINRKIKVYTKDECYEIYGQITELAQQMKKYGFGTPHSSFVVNFAYVKAMKRNELELSIGYSIPITKYRIKDFRDEHATFLKDQMRKSRI